MTLKFDNRLAKLIYAGSDMFLMPSRFEPGLGQMIAMKYGTIPLVRKTGGLADTVENLSLDGKKGTGFVFEDYRGEDLLFVIKRAVEAFHATQIMVRSSSKGNETRFLLGRFRPALEIYGKIQEKPDKTDFTRAPRAAVSRSSKGVK